MILVVMTHQKKEYTIDIPNNMDDSVSNYVEGKKSDRKEYIL